MHWLTTESSAARRKASGRFLVGIPIVTSGADPDITWRLRPGRPPSQSALRRKVEPVAALTRYATVDVAAAPTMPKGRHGEREADERDGQPSELG